MARGAAFYLVQRTKSNEGWVSGVFTRVVYQRAIGNVEHEHAKHNTDRAGEDLHSSIYLFGRLIHSVLSECDTGSNRCVGGHFG